MKDYAMNDTASCSDERLEVQDLPWDLMSHRLVTSLESLGVQTIADLAALSEHDIACTKNAGKRTVAEARGILASLGLRLAVRHGKALPRVERVLAFPDDGDLVQGWNHIARYLNVSQSEAKLYAAAGGSDRLPVYWIASRVQAYTRQLDRWRAKASGNLMFAHRQKLRANASVYVLTYETSGRFKVGFSNDVQSRAKDLEAGCGYPVRVIATMPGDYTLESEIHTLLDGHRRMGEWFELCEDALRVVLQAVTHNGGSIEESDPVWQAYPLLLERARA